MISPCFESLCINIRENIHQLDMSTASSKTEEFLFKKELAWIIHLHEK